MDEQTRIDQIIENLYAGALDAAAWGHAMAGMTDLLHCSGVILFAADPSTQTVTRDEVYPGVQEIMRLYREHWAAEDIRITHGLTAPVGEPRHERQMVEKHEWQRTAILNEFLLPLDIPFILATWLHKSPHKVVAITFEGSLRRGPFDENDSRQFKRLIPHVRRALEIRDRLGAYEVRASALSSVVEQSHIGVIMLDQKGRILDATGLAEQLLKVECGMHRASDHALCLREPAGSQLRQWVMTGLPPKDNLQGCLSVPRGGGLQSIRLLVTPMPAVRVAWTGTDPRWLVFIFDPERRLAPVAEFISRELGISAREGEIAVLLSLGHTLSSVATRLGISLHTVRVHLKHIFEKTGCHSQSDLVRLVLLSPAIHIGHN
ncbi:MAG: helix-turn-helix transcriptional regulator [Pseudomonadota bacterium]|nr:helix-turn-helix transcriptional regulator [Pseudomonadota bacterium]